MGNPLYSDDVGSMCYNPAKSWQLGWYDSPASNKVTIRAQDTDNWTGDIVGIADYDNNPNNLPMLIKVLFPSDSNTYFIGFNRAKGPNADNVMADDKVTIVYTEYGGGEQYSQSWFLRQLGSEESYVITSTNLNLNVEVMSIAQEDPWYANIRLTAVECFNDSNCDDQKPCTRNVCRNNECVSTTIANCCRTNAGCNDNDICTRNICNIYNRCTYPKIAKCCTKHPDCAQSRACMRSSCNLRTKRCNPPKNLCKDKNKCTRDLCRNNGKCANPRISGCKCKMTGACTKRAQCCSNRCVRRKCIRP